MCEGDVQCSVELQLIMSLAEWLPVAALHQGAPGQMTWLEIALSLLCFGNSVNRKNVSDRFICFIVTFLMLTVKIATTSFFASGDLA